MTVDTIPQASEMIETMKEVAAKKPLAHPLAFSMAEMNFDLAPAPHLIDIYHSVYMGLNPDKYPNAFSNYLKLEPRDHGKSEVGSHVIPSWKALEDPNTRILIMMESEGQAKDKLAECSETIRRLAPKYGRKIENDSALELKLERDEVHDVPTIRAAGFETSVTGGHYDLIIFDDLISDESVLTESRRKKNWEKFQERLNLRSGNDTVFLTLGTRKHPEDLYKKLIDSPGWDVTVEKAIGDWSVVENGDYHVVARDPETGEVNRYPAGERPNNTDIIRVECDRDPEALWPERYSGNELIYNYLTGSLEDEDAQDEGLEGSRVWVRENQNEADALMGDILSADMLTFVDGLPGDRRLDDLPVYAGLDPAIEPDAEKAATGDTDYWAWSVAYYDPRHATFYIDDLRRKRGMTMKEAITWVQSHMARYPTRNIYVEANQAQQFLVQSLREPHEEHQGLFVKEVDSNRNKEDAIRAMSSRFENGKAVILGNEKTPRWDSFIQKEWVTFPTGDHDDRLDAIRMVLSARNQEDEEAKRTTQRPFV